MNIPLKVLAALFLVGLFSTIATYGYVRGSSDSDYCEYFQEIAGNFYDRREDKRWIKDTMYMIDTTTDIDQEAKDLSKLLVIFATKAPDRETAKRTVESLCPVFLRYRKDIFPQ